MTKRSSPRKTKIPVVGIESIIKDLHFGPQKFYSAPRPFHNLVPEHIPPSPLDPDGIIFEKYRTSFPKVARIMHALAFLREVGTEPEIRQRKEAVLRAQEQYAWVSRFRLNAEEDKKTEEQLRFMAFEFDLIAERARAFEDALYKEGVRYDSTRKVAVFIGKDGKKKAGAPRKVVNVIAVFLYDSLRKEFDKYPSVKLHREIKDRFTSLGIYDVDETLIALAIANHTARELRNL
jgi:hypothetical protein